METIYIQTNPADCQYGVFYWAKVAYIGEWDLLLLLGYYYSYNERKKK